MLTLAVEKALPPLKWLFLLSWNSSVMKYGELSGVPHLMAVGLFILIWTVRNLHDSIYIIINTSIRFKHHIKV